VPRRPVLLAIAALAAATARAAGGPPGAAPAAPIAPPPAPCVASDAVSLLASPAAPGPGRRLSVLAATDAPRDAALVIVGPGGERRAAATDRHDGPPWWWSAETTIDAPGTYRIELDDGSGGVLGCREVRAGATPAGAPRPATGAWAVTRDWDRGAERLYAAWVAKLFDDPPNEEPSWTSLHEVTRQPWRNALHDHLGLGEDDDDGLRLEPDCADLPYFLRAYFAWKLGLPFGWSDCDRGGNGTPPRCTGWHSNVDGPPPSGADPRASMQAFFARRLAWAVQSGAGRTPADTDRSDLYPTRLAPETLTPGTVYADPYGHTLVVVRRVPQTADGGGLLLAVDAQPDGTVARKRYWRGTFLFALDPTLGSPGFKHFRPVVRDGAGLRPLRNAEIADDPDYGDWSLDQYAGGVDRFYDRVDDVLSPARREPARVLVETIDALDEQIRARVRSVANGVAWVAAGHGTIPMPEGAEIFETSGPWEAYATPARDLRLLIAIDVVRRLPDEVVRRPDRFAMPPEASPSVVRAQLRDLLRSEAARREVAYERSDGSTWRLTLADVLARAEALEVAYDPNDCPEVRWGAPAGSAEIATCTRHAPAADRARMARHRAWFHERRRPAR